MTKIKSQPQQQIIPATDRGLSRQQVAEMTGFSVHNLANLGVLNQGPPFRKHKLGKRGKVVYLESEVLAWLRALPVHGGGQAGA